MASTSSCTTTSGTSAPQSSPTSPSLPPTSDIDIVSELAFSNVPWPVRPTPGINYDFVALMYLGGSALAAFFFVLERYILAPLLVEQSPPNSTTDSTIASNGDTAGAQDGEQWKEFARGMEGMYVVFVPFAPCLIWSLVVRYFWIKETKILEEEKKKK
mmetsp:Transcript_24251/g.51195  ORF Transcript_24251/g.51195 Transcript_24251/m.51195 type:complete len:158 (+) Transcript_24251:73-546(+)|eukprot:CAMPEP_0171356888 /NCGR_PEP_ID=MMETSP0878-20121228/45960_1 /TAXON_ID=67004 /ORGANISM="Thalassiosira weissflogii, Strain CCMP1336" /LENGTH=157 /DNA_ID=CAMNT_0011862919 /DNA_START=64 /DNA_END=537 /DNA_ORIENTATION=+